MSRKPGDAPTIEKFYIREAGKGVCLHALAAMLTLPAPSLRARRPQRSESGKRRTRGTRSAQTPENRTRAEEP
jgi:hypothetical protein